MDLEIEEHSEQEEREERRVMAEMTTTPSTNGEIPLPRKVPRGLLPSTWLTRSVRVEYVGADGMAGNTDATLLELYPFGPVLNIAGVKTALSWDTLRLIELRED